MKDFGVRHGAQGTEDRVEYEFFFSVQEAKEYFNSRGIKIVGIEIGNNARNVYGSGVFEGDTVLVPGNEGDGLLPQLKNICDYFVYIPQFTNKTASLNVAIATSIIFSQFCQYAKYPEQQVFGEKFRPEGQDEIDKEVKKEQMMGKRDQIRTEKVTRKASQDSEGLGETFEQEEQTMDKDVKS